MKQIKVTVEMTQEFSVIVEAAKVLGRDIQVTLSPIYLVPEGNEGGFMKSSVYTDKYDIDREGKRND